MCLLPSLGHDPWMIDGVVVAMASAARGETSKGRNGSSSTPARPTRECTAFRCGLSGHCRVLRACLASITDAGSSSSQPSRQPHPSAIWEGDRLFLDNSVVYFDLMLESSVYIHAPNYYIDMHMFNKNSDLIRVGGPQTSVSIEVLQWYFLIPPQILLRCD